MLTKNQQLLTIALFAAISTNAQAARDCSASEMKDILAKAKGDEVIKVACNVTLSKSQRITKRLVLSGPAASGVTIDCKGGAIGLPGSQAKVLRVMSKMVTAKDGTHSWERPENVTVKNCVIHGPIRVMGMASNGEGPHLRDSSRRPGHTGRVQANAPTGTNFENVTFMGGSSGIALYLSPGTTRTTVRNSRFEGRGGLAIYMDAESAENRILNNNFSLETEKREIIAVDASANNEIVGNRFSGLKNGGIFLYRNCGEGGNIRHQTPHGNEIIDNIFVYKKYRGMNPAIFVGSRDGNRRYCDLDDGYDLGSSKSNKDFAFNNVVARNQIMKRGVAEMIRVFDPAKNFVRANQTVGKPEKRDSACFVKNAFPSEILKSGQFTTQVLAGNSVSCTGKKLTCRDGEIVKEKYNCEASKPKVVDFGCQAISKGGCSGTVSCPAGTRAIVATRALCNLEWGRITDKALANAKWGDMSVARESSRHAEYGRCEVGGKAISTNSASLAHLRGRTDISFACSESHEKNGGDCHVRGQVICQ